MWSCPLSTYHYHRRQASTERLLCIILPVLFNDPTNRIFIPRKTARAPAYFLQKGKLGCSITSLHVNRRLRLSQGRSAAEGSGMRQRGKCPLIIPISRGISSVKAHLAEFFWLETYSMAMSVAESSQRSKTAITLLAGCLIDSRS